MESTAIGVGIVANPTEQNLPYYSRFQQIGIDSSETKAETESEQESLHYQRGGNSYFIMCQNCFKIHSIGFKLTRIIHETVRVLVLSEYWSIASRSTTEIF